jgi:hypothetical protein
MSDVDLVHLVWKAAGIGPFQRFLEAYRRHSAGVEHQMIVLYNGFAEEDDLGAYRELLGGLRHHELQVPRPVQDIEAYFWAARRTDSRYVSFLNSHSEVLAPDWLLQLCRHVEPRGVGAVGATGSWESMYTNYIRASTNAPTKWFGERLARTLKRQWKERFLSARFDPYPNAHLRTNAFLIERERWLSLHAGSFATKWDAWGFESGKQSLTRRLLAHGLDVVVVGRNGVAYAKDEWKASGTFRRDNQRNLLVADNRTRQYAEAGDEDKRYLASLAWGDSS